MGDSICNIFLCPHAVDILDFLDKTSVKAPNKQFHLALPQPYRLCCLLAISFIHVSLMSKQVIPDASCFLCTVNTPRKLVRRQAEESSHWFCSKLKFITLDGIAKVKVIIFPALVLGPDILFIFFSFWDVIYSSPELQLHISLSVVLFLNAFCVSPIATTDP